MATEKQIEALEQIQEATYEIRDYLVQLKDFFNSEQFTKLPQGLQDYIAESAEAWENERWNRLRKLILEYPDIGEFDI